MSFFKIHWVYILAFICLVFIIPKVKQKISQSEEYFGIAENQVRSYSRSSDVMIKSLYIKLGQEVKIGDTLMVFQPRNLYYKKQDLESQSRILDINKKADKYTQGLEMQLLESQKQNIHTEYALKINRLRDQKKIADSLARIITNQNISDSRLQMEIQNLESMKNMELEQVNQKLAMLKNELVNTPDPTGEKINTISNEINRINEQEKELVLIADMNGVVGQLDYQTGDAINAFQSIVKIYSLHPTLVTSYISEQYLGKVTYSDSVTIQSITNENYSLTGKVLNLGSRITALPDRLKKIPELKAWGREIQLEIPIDNQLIQGEKVKVIFPVVVNK